MLHQVAVQQEITEKSDEISAGTLAKVFEGECLPFDTNAAGGVSVEAFSSYLEGLWQQAMTDCSA